MTGRAGRHGDRLPRPGSAPVVLLAFSALFEVLGRIVSAPLLTWIAAGAVGAVLAAALTTPRLSGRTVRSAHPDRLTAGIPAAVTFTSVASGKRPVPLLVTLSDPLPATTFAIRPDSAWERHRVTFLPAQRGWWQGGMVEVAVTSPLGGWSRRRRLLLGKPLIVHPAPARPIPLAPVEAGADGGTAARPRPGPAGADDVVGLRDWRPGDPVSRVHWRASARLDRLIVADRERSVRQRLVVVVGAHGRGESWEAAIARTAATCVAELAAVGAVEFWRDGTSERLRTPRAVLDAFAGLERPPTAPVRDRGLEPGAGGHLLWLGASPPVPQWEQVARRQRLAVIDVLRRPAAPPARAQAA